MMNVLTDPAILTVMVVVLSAMAGAYISVKLITRQTRYENRAQIEKGFKDIRRQLHLKTDR